MLSFKENKKQKTFISVPEDNQTVIHSNISSYEANLEAYSNTIG